MSFEDASKIAEAVFCVLVGDSAVDSYEEVESLRSRPHSDFVDVKVGEQWYRVTSVEIDDPTSVCEHFGCDKHPCSGHDPKHGSRT